MTIVPGDIETTAEMIDAGARVLCQTHDLVRSEIIARTLAAEVFSEMMSAAPNPRQPKKLRTR
jgi:fatty acid/phospholipid biosynthesis enzyme